MSKELYETGVHIKSAIDRLKVAFPGVPFDELEQVANQLTGSVVAAPDVLPEEGHLSEALARKLDELNGNTIGASVEEKPAPADKPEHPKGRSPAPKD